MHRLLLPVIGAMLLIPLAVGWSQQPPPGRPFPPRGGFPPPFPGGGFPPDGFPPPPGMGNRGGMGGPPGKREELKLVGQFDVNHDGWLNTSERNAASDFLKTQPPRGRGGPPGAPPGASPTGPSPGARPRGPGMPHGPIEPGQPGARVSPNDVQPVSSEQLYDPRVVRTLFLEFEHNAWEAELERFHDTDVEVPATLTVDGKPYPGVGVRFRGNSSYDLVPSGSKRSLNLSLDLVDAQQQLLGYKTLNLLNSHEDPTFMHTVLYSHIARKYIPAPKANFVRVVINGESWGLYVNTQQFDKIFLAENYSSSKGTRWKVPGNPMGGAGLSYLGDDLEAYKRRYEMKSSDGEKAWQALVSLCRMLDPPPLQRLMPATSAPQAMERSSGLSAGPLESRLEGLLDLDHVLWFLALDITLINSDGYWSRASDYSLFRDNNGQFHVIPHDMNEAFQPPMGPGMGLPPGGPPGMNGMPQGGRPLPPGNRETAPLNVGSGYALDPLTGLTDASKPLRSKLLTIPSLRKRYLEHVRSIATDELDWQSIGPLVHEYRQLIENEVAADTRKLTSMSDFRRATAEIGASETPGEKTRSNIAMFARERRKYLLNHVEIKKLPY